MLELYYKRAEQIIIIVMIIGIIAVFRPWFSDLVGLFEGFAPDINLERTFQRETSVIIFRMGVYATLLGLIAFIFISHHTPTDFRDAFSEKGPYLASLLLALPLIYGIFVIENFAIWSGMGIILNVFNFICAIAVWNRKTWGVIGLGLSTLYGFILGFGEAAPFMPNFTFLLTIALGILLWFYQPELLIPLWQPIKVIWTKVVSASVWQSLGQSKFGSLSTSVRESPPVSTRNTDAQQDTSSQSQPSATSQSASQQDNLTPSRSMRATRYIILFVVISLIIFAIVYFLRQQSK